MESIKRFVEVLEKPNSELNFREKIRKFIGVVFVGLFGFFIVGFLRRINNQREITQERRNKLKYFKPIIEEGLFLNKTTWVMRDTPLTEDTLDELFKTMKW